MKSSIARLFGLCSLFFGLAVNGRSDDYSIYLANIQDYLQDINNRSINMYNPSGPYLSEYGFNGRMNELRQILSYGQTTSSRDNIMTYLREIRDASSDGLNSNPWWATNSAFALSWDKYVNAFPDDGLSDAGSFSLPQFLSVWSSRLSVKDAAPLASSLRDTWFDKFGHSDLQTLAGSVSAYRQRRSYTWFDWMADAMRSNLTLFSTAHISTYEALSNEQASVSSSYAEEQWTTNEVPQVPEFEVELQSVDGFTAVSRPLQSMVSSLQPPMTGRSSTLVVLPAFDFGPIHTRQYTFDFNTSITPYCRGIMSFVWIVMALSMSFRLLSGEWAFYTSLGRTKS